MKKLLLSLLALTMVVTLAACSSKKWTKEGFYADENENMLSVTYMEDVTVPGWYVGVMLGDSIDDSYGNIVQDKNGTLQGTLTSSGDNAPLEVTVSEEGEDGMKLVIKGGETYHFKKAEWPEATIIVHVTTEGPGNIEYVEGEATPEYDEEYPYQSAQINLAESAVYTFLAWSKDATFVKWTKNGEDFSTEPQITVLLDESADFVAVFQ